MKFVQCLIPVLCLLLGSGLCRAQAVGSANSFCFTTFGGTASNLSCADSIQGATAYEELRSRFFGGVLRRVWQNSKKRHQRNKLQETPEMAGIQKKDVWKKMLRDADYDFGLTSHRFVMSMRVQF
ncbi:MAG: hypothetical protein JKY01_08775 [Pseudomonadales bacterium]|nr:hypothetical protein [Pseudomonadales bacterium]